jgi:16S rRNA U516 pseudouridylate synthase RsuA-like enzyme
MSGKVIKILKTGYMVHRLDRETSGILVFAKSEQVKMSCRITGIRLKAYLVSFMVI